MYGMSVREVRGCASLTPFIDRVIDGGPDTVTAPDDALSVRDYLDLMLAGASPSHRCGYRLPPGGGGSPATSSR
jgi:hypothetical protein